MVTVVTWWWQGWRNMYCPANVYRMQEMLKEHLKTPHRFVCVTDQPEKLPGIETVKLWPTPDIGKRYPYLPNCYARLFLFSHQAKDIFGEHVISIDLDAIITSEIADLFDDSAFKILTADCNPYNGSLWQVKPGSYPHVWENLNASMVKAANNVRMPNGRKYYGSDQAIMAYMIPKAATWDHRKGSGIYQYLDVKDKMPADAKILFFAGTVKPWTSEYEDLYWGGSVHRKDQWIIKSNSVVEM